MAREAWLVKYYTSTVVCLGNNTSQGACLQHKICPCMMQIDLGVSPNKMYSCICVCVCQLGDAQREVTHRWNHHLHPSGSSTEFGLAYRVYKLGWRNLTDRLLHNKQKVNTCVNTEMFTCVKCVAVNCRSVLGYFKKQYFISSIFSSATVISLNYFTLMDFCLNRLYKSQFGVIKICSCFLK